MHWGPRVVWMISSYGIATATPNIIVYAHKLEQTYFKDYFSKLLTDNSPETSATITIITR